MFYFPLIVTTWPDWVPMWGGHEFIFFSPVFNFADSCISVGVVALILFYRHQLEHLSEIFFEGTRFAKNEASPQPSPEGEGAEYANVNKDA